MKAAIIGTMVAFGSAAVEKGVAPLEMMQKDRAMALSFINGTHSAKPNNFEKTTGALVYTFHSDASTCTSKASSGVGYVYGECISGDGVNGKLINNNHYS